MWKDVIELGNMTEAIVHGEPIQTMVYREVFAQKMAVKRSEFYQAANAGLKPEVVFMVRSSEFSNDERIRYPIGDTGKVYAIIRAYDKGETTELTVSAWTGSEL